MWFRRYLRNKTTPKIMKTRGKNQRKTKTSHHDNKHPTQNTYFETKNPSDVFTDETSYDSESKDELNFQREGSSESTGSKPTYNRSKPSQKQRNYRGNTERYGNNPKDFSRRKGNTNKLNVKGTLRSKNNLSSKEREKWKKKKWAITDLNARHGSQDIPSQSKQWHPAALTK